MKSDLSAAAYIAVFGENRRKRMVRRSCHEGNTADHSREGMNVVARDSAALHTRKQMTRTKRYAPVKGSNSN